MELIDVAVELNVGRVLRPAILVLGCREGIHVRHVIG